MRISIWVILLAVAMVAVPVVAAEQSPVSSALSTNNSPEYIRIAKERGAKTAATDIKAGELRLLHYGEPWSNGKPLVDETTGYRVQIVGGCLVSESFVAEVGAYNNAMREWQAKTRITRDKHR